MNPKGKRTGTRCPVCRMQTVALSNDTLRCVSSKKCNYSEKLSTMESLKREIIIEEIEGIGEER